MGTLGTTQFRVMNRGAQRVGGQSMVEFIVILPSLLLLVLGIVQFALVFMAKSTLDTASYEGVRQGTLHNASVSSIKRGIGKGLTPLYQKFFRTGQTYPHYLLARAQALAVASNPLDVELDILNPTKAAFATYGELISVNGKTFTEIPNSRLMWRSTVVPGVGENIQDANLLKIRVRYCYPLFIPFIGRAIKAMVGTLIPAGGAFNSQCYVRNGLPMQADATMLMQSPARQ